MNIDIEPVKPLTDLEIEQLRELAGARAAVRLGSRELQAVVASLDRLQVLERQNAELRQANDLMIRDQVSPTVAIGRLEQWLIRLAEIVRTSRPDLANGLANEIRREVARG